MMKCFVYVLLTMAVMVSLSGCRSDADLMAEFCLDLAEASKTESCTEMADRMNQILDRQQPRLRDTSICTDTTACMPCRVGVREMLKRCGYDEAMKPVLQKMHFSSSLRDELSQQKEAP